MLEQLAAVREVRELLFHEVRLDVRAGHHEGPGGGLQGLQAFLRRKRFALRNTRDASDAKSGDVLRNFGEHE